MRPQIEISPLDYEQVLEWEDAKLYCFSLTVDDKTGWRLPTLADLIDIYTRSDIECSPERYWASDIMDEDLENIKGDLANNYKTIPILYGETISKKTITTLSLLTLLPIYILIEKFNIGYMDLYFYFCLIILVFFLLYLWKANKKEQFLLLHNVLKFLIVTGVFSIILINPQVLWNGQRLFL